MPYTPDRTGIKDLNRFPFYHRDRLTDDIANDIIGFDHPINPWAPANIPGGAGSWSTSLAAGGTFETTTYPHFLQTSVNAVATAQYLQWTNAAAKYSMRANIAVGIWNATGDNNLLYEIRLWETQAPGAATKYFAFRWNKIANHLSFATYYGTGITFAYNNGTINGAGVYLAWGQPYQCRLTINPAGGPLATYDISESEGYISMFSTTSNAGVPAGFKTVWFYQPATIQTQALIDDIQLY